VLTPDTSLAVPPEDPAALADAVTTLLEDEPLRLALGAAARAEAEAHYGWADIARRLEGVYERIAGATRARAAA
jgi:glycosyltransferase involved in cell wall biosynthesis